MCLRNKYKDMRKRMPPGCPEVDAQKAKFKARKLGESPVASSKTGFRRQTIVMSTFEMDSAFVTEATDFMKKELKKQNPNTEKVEDAMLRTTVARRRSMDLDGMSLTDVASLYPALTLEKGILNECRRLSGVSPDEALLRALGEFGEHILNATAHKQAAQSTLCSLQKEISVDNRIARNYAKGLAAITVLPFLVSEGDGIHRNDTRKGVSASNRCPLSSLSSDAMCVKCENVCVDVLDFTAGLSLLFSMYWTYNIEYFSSAKTTLCLLEHLIGIHASKLSTRGIKVLTTLKARSAANNVQPGCIE